MTDVIQEPNQVLKDFQLALQYHAQVQRQMGAFSKGKDRWCEMKPADPFYKQLYGEQ